METSNTNKNPVGRPLKFKNEKELQKKVDAWLKKCKKEERPLTITGLALALDTTRDVLIDYENREEFSYTIKKAKARVEGFVERKLMGGGHPAGPIFNLKNNFKKWEDKTIVDNPAEAKYHQDVDKLREKVYGKVESVKKKKK